MFSCVSGSMADRWMLLYSGCYRQVGIVVSLAFWQTGCCCRQVNIVVSLVVWLICGCYCKVVAIGR